MGLLKKSGVWGLGWGLQGERDRQRDREPERDQVSDVKLVRPVYRDPYCQKLAYFYSSEEEDSELDAISN